MSQIITLVALVIGLLVGGGIQQLRISSLKTEHATTLKNIAEQTSKAYEAVIAYKDSVSTQLTTIRADNAKQVQILNEQLKTTTAARDSYVVRLRKLSTTQPTSTSTIPTTRSTSENKSNRATLDLFIDMLDRHTRELTEVGEYADRLREAGLMCEKSYDAHIQ